MLNDFFRINMPYCFSKLENGNWVCLNREYSPIGFVVDGYHHFEKIPVGANYRRVSEKRLLNIVSDPNRIERDQNGEITRIYLYGDGTNPVNQSHDKDQLWEDYFKKLRLLSKFKL